MNYRTLLIAVPFGALFISIALRGMSALAVPDISNALRSLDPATRGRFQMERTKLAECEDVLQAERQRAYSANPLLKEAAARLGRANDMATKAGSSGARVKQYYEKQGAEAIARYRRWRQCEGEILDAEFMATIANDPPQRPFAAWLAGAAVAQFLKHPETAPTSVRHVLSSKPSLTEDIEVRAYLGLLQENAQKHKAKCAELKLALNPPRFVREYVRALHLANSNFNIYSMYLTKMSPPEIKEAEKMVKRQATVIDGVWPGWRKAEQDALTANREGAMERHGLVDSTGGTPLRRPSLLGLAAVLLGVSVMLYRWRRSRP